jgi:hypothetical protein
MPTIADLIVVATEYGIFEFYLPFLIMFAVFYGLLTKMKLFGDPYAKEKSAKMARVINLIIALSASMFLMAYTPLGISLASFLGGMFGQTSLILITLVCAGLILYVLGVLAGFDIFKLTSDKDKKPTPAAIKLIVVVVGLVAAAMVISNSGVLLPGIGGDTGITIPGLDITAQDAMIIGLVILTAFAIWYVVRAPGGKEE